VPGLTEYGGLLRDGANQVLNATDQVPTAEILRVINYTNPQVAHGMANGRMNTDESQVLKHISHAIRRGHPQWRGGPIRHDRIALVGNGPSLNETKDELRQIIWEGATLVTLNGGYHWAIENGFQPKTQIVMDARPTNARFVQPDVPKCNYVLASQCAPEVWDAVEGRNHVWVFHSVVKQEGATSDLLDQFYGGNWIGISGGTTVATRAIGLLRTAGYVRFDLFGIDCCVPDQGYHHATPQPENDGDRYMLVTLTVGDVTRRFKVSYWQLKQFEDLLTIIRVNGKHFSLEPHGDGMFSCVLRAIGAGSDLESLKFNLSEDERAAYAAYSEETT
jgi:hypothetical protein